MRSQLLGQLRATGFVRARGGNDIRDLNTNSENWAVVKVNNKFTFIFVAFFNDFIEFRICYFQLNVHL